MLRSGSVPNSSDNFELLADFSKTTVFKIETLDTNNTRGEVVIDLNAAIQSLVDELKVK